MAEQMQISLDIFRHLRVGDFQDISEYLDSHPTMNMNLRNEESETMLIYCVKRMAKEWTLPFGGQYDKICELLIPRNVDLNLQDKAGNTATHCAADLKLLKVLKMLVSNGARLDICRTDGACALDLMAERGDLDWMIAVFGESTIIAEERIHLAVDVQYTLFHRLLSTNHVPCIRWICQHRPEMIEAKNEESLTSLHIVVTENNVDALEILLDCGANTEVVDKEGHTPLHFAVVYDHIDCLLVLLRSGAEVNCQDAYHRTPLHFALGRTLDDGAISIKNNRMFIEHLLNYDASMTLPDSGGRLPLHWAANTGNTNGCKMLISRGCKVNRTCNEGLTALHTAASEGHAECIRVLVVNGNADVNSPDKTGHSPLFYAIITEHIDCAELLLYGGASPNYCNKDGDCPAHFAATKELTSALEILHKYEGSLELENKDGNRPLHKAALRGRRDAVDYMLKCKCEVGVRNKEGFTPLHLAASVGAIDVCRRLLEGKATHVNDILIQYENDVSHFLTALDVAYLNNHEDCQQLLKGAGGVRGLCIAESAASNIQKCWRTKHFVEKDPKEEQCIEPNGGNLAETDDKYEKIEGEQVLVINNENDEVQRALSETNLDSHGTIEKSCYHNEKNDRPMRETADRIQEIPVKEGTKFDEHSRKIRSSNYISEQVSQNDEGSSKSTHSDRSKPKYRTKKLTGTVTNKSSVSTATQSARLEEQRKGTKGRLNNEKCTTNSSLRGSLGKAKTQESKSNQRRSKLVHEEGKVLGSTDKKISKLPDIKDEVAANSKCRQVEQGFEIRKNKKTRKSHRPCGEDESRDHERCLEESLNVEISRTEKISQDVVRLKENLNERSHNLDKRLKVVEQRLRE